MDDGAVLSQIGKAIRKRRERLGLSQEQLAEKANCHRNFIGLVERGERNITVLKLRDVCKALGTSLSDLLRALK